MTWNVRHLTTTIDAASEAVVAVAGDPAQLPRWAAGLSAGIRQEDDGRWVTDSPMGEVEVRFVGPLGAGVLDHDVVLPNGSVTRNPVRVLPNDEGSEVVFTLFQRTGMSDADFAADARQVQEDLDRLASLFRG
ncbi:SRPBCC family protein [Herbiconiux sp. CPCC 203407]|uniref:SRPBCC family protein n=1 Tax=Herbiconiux oxytropis TaxID=2970915 RepID=A0AA41XFK9_9MICO|nr:SRPBCC family protein [Herbiconiux oxytropis]MCS5723118.1 SRPBCC family protein [Herbiconiux oxytropis]MCS5725325.1 SRPBCC family protein [Herbiconiux oxytropis]